jgi:aryl-alcohol dehydrogenase-like predicted oxidoreductase
MELRRLGRTALRVSELCLGTMNFGPLTTQEDSFVIMDRALDLGINFFDTANRYGGPKGPGTTETIIGNWFAQGGGRREKVVLATKVFGPMPEWPNDGGPPARHIRGVRSEPARLQTDHFDLPDASRRRNAPCRAVWQAIETLSTGKVIYVSSSNRGWRQANEAASSATSSAFEEQTSDLASRTVELEVLPRPARPRSHPRSPLAGDARRVSGRVTPRVASPNPRYEALPQLEKWRSCAPSSARAGRGRSRGCCSAAR